MSQLSSCVLRTIFPCRSQTDSRALLGLAIATFNKGGISLRAAAKLYGVSKETLRRALKQGLTTAAHWGRRQLFTPTQEKEIVAIVLKHAAEARAVTPTELCQIARHMGRKFGIPSTLFNGGEKWLRAFMKRNHELSLRIVKTTSRGRLIMFNPITIAQWQALYSGIYGQYKPEAILNKDDMGINVETISSNTRVSLLVASACISTKPMSLSPSSLVFNIFRNPVLQVLAKRGADNVRMQQTQKGGHISVTMCGPARGPMLPSVITFAGTSLRKSKIPGTENTYQIFSPNGWAGRETHLLHLDLIKEYMDKEGLDKVLLLCDNSSLNANPEFVDRCRTYRIRVMTLPPQCTGKIQPLDVNYFGGLKNCIRRLARDDRNPVTEDNLGFYLEKAVKHLQAGSKGSPLAGGFKMAGLFPFNKDVFTDEDFAPAVARLGISMEHPAVKKARMLEPVDFHVEWEHGFALSSPPLDKSMKLLVDEEAKLGRFDPAACLLTDNAAVKLTLEKNAAKKKEEEDKAARVQKRKEVKEQRDKEAAEKKASIAAKKQEREAAKVAKETADAAKAAAAPAPKPSAPVAPVDATGDAMVEEPPAPVEVSRAGRKRKVREYE